MSEIDKSKRIEAMVHQNGEHIRLISRQLVYLVEIWVIAVKCQGRKAWVLPAVACARGGNSDRVK